jgi:hypothetical protein
MRVRLSLWRCLLAPFAVGCLIISNAAPAEACSCGAWTSFADVSRSVPIVVEAGVAAIGPSTTTQPNDPTFIEIAVDRVRKGKLSTDRVKVWNAGAGTSCGGAFADMPVGTRLRIALSPVVRLSEQEEKDRELYWLLVGFKPPIGDYLATTGCATGFEVMGKPG